MSEVVRQRAGSDRDRPQTGCNQWEEGYHLLTLLFPIDLDDVILKCCSREGRVGVCLQSIQWQIDTIILHFAHMPTENKINFVTHWFTLLQWITSKYNKKDIVNLLCWPI